MHAYSEIGEARLATYLANASAKHGRQGRSGKICQPPKNDPLGDSLTYSSMASSIHITTPRAGPRIVHPTSWHVSLQSKTLICRRSHIPRYTHGAHNITAKNQQTRHAIQTWYWHVQNHVRHCSVAENAKRNCNSTVTLLSILIVVQ
jgi:hypothetical protein